MEEQIRTQLYRNLDWKPVFNPKKGISKPPSPLVVDLTIDVSNSSRQYHLKTEKVRQLLSQADLIVCDTERMVHTIKKHAKTLVTAAPFGACGAGDKDDEKGIRVGLLHHSADTELNNMGNRKLLKALGEEFLIFGGPIDGIEGEVIEDFNQFAARCDILLLPSIINSINSTTMPISAMMAGTAVIARNSGGYCNLDGASGTFLIPTDSPADWKNRIEFVRSDPRRLEQFKQFNTKYAKAVSSDSVAKLTRLAHRMADQQIARKRQVALATG